MKYPNKLGKFNIIETYSRKVINNWLCRDPHSGNFTLTNNNLTVCSGNQEGFIIHKNIKEALLVYEAVCLIFTRTPARYREF